MSLLRRYSVWSVYSKSEMACEKMCDGSNFVVLQNVGKVSCFLGVHACNLDEQLDERLGISGMLRNVYKVVLQMQSTVLKSRKHRIFIRP